MAAIDASHFLPHGSRKMALAVGGSLLLHVLLLAWLPPLIPVMRDVGQALPSILEVRLVTEAPAPLPTLPKPSVVQPPRVVKPEHTAPEVHTSAPTATMTASSPQPVSTLAEPAEAARVPASAPNPEHVAAITPPDLRAAYLSNPRPPYPLAARRLGLEGRVVLRAEISENGLCNRISISQSSGHDILDQAALQAVKQWRFIAARRGGEAVSAWAEIPITFRLRETASTGS